jgi:transcriptional regulator with XRE-family HTH domain
MPIIKAKPKTIPSARIKGGYSLRGLARKTNLNPTTIMKLERGLANPCPETSKIICDALGLGFDDLFIIEED